MYEDNYRILIVDDTPAIHQDFRKILLKEENVASHNFDQLHALLFNQLVEKKANRLPLFEIDSAYQGQEAMTFVKHACASNKPYAVSFVDVIMPPGEDGIETIRHIWEADAEMQTIICTAYTMCSWDDIIRRLGESDRLFVLKKPFDSSEVIQLACLLTQKWNLNRKLQEIKDSSAKDSQVAIQHAKSKLTTIFEELKNSGHVRC